MTRTLQIRRGGTAQNDNFTGLAGEITMDATRGAETVRAHDGATLGGFALARADLANVSAAALAATVNSALGGTGGAAGDGMPAALAAAPFDINGVSADFWNALFREYNLRTTNFGQSAACDIGTASYIEYIFDAIHSSDIDLGAATADTVLICRVPQAGYSIGDIVYAFGIGARATPRPVAFCDENGLHLRQLVNNEPFWVSHKTTGEQTSITNPTWKMIFRVWY
ncbi:MAG: hypothetical protein FWC61_01245 [Proteobacteria bacterium]|nr:hypothetical protein [Pseudomonadota bacterium]